MTRTQRIQPVKRLVDARERELALAAAQSRQRLIDMEAKLAELARYRTDYHLGFQKQAAGGTSGLRLRDFRLFLGRLDEAIRQQELAVARARSELETQTRTWHESLRRAKALGFVVDKWQGEERVAADRQDQRDTDERAAGMAARRSRNGT
jgi:flagellar FliJ protein